jgi:hypothetical protein
VRRPHARRSCRWSLRHHRQDADATLRHSPLPVRHPPYAAHRMPYAVCRMPYAVCLPAPLRPVSVGRRGDLSTSAAADSGWRYEPEGLSPVSCRMPPSVCRMPPAPLRPVGATSRKACPLPHALRLPARHRGAARKNFLFRFRSAAVAGRKPWARRIASASFTVIRPAVLTGTRTMTGASMLQVELDVALIVGP